MKKTCLLLAIGVFVFGNCKKTANTNIPTQTPNGIGGYGLSAISGLFNISLPKNSDTTVIMPIIVYAIIYETWDPTISISFGPMPKDIVGYTPSIYQSSTKNQVIDTVIFQIHAIDTGTFPIKVIASSLGGNPSEIIDSFNLLVH